MYRAVIPGRPIVKKNTQRVVGYGRKRRVVYSKNYLAWLQIAMMTIKMNRPSSPYNGQLEAEFKFYFANRQSEADVSNLVEGIQDALKNADVIEDDKLIMRFTAEKFFGHEPRTEVVLREYEPRIN